MRACVRAYVCTYVCAYVCVTDFNHAHPKRQTPGCFFASNRPYAMNCGFKSVMIRTVDAYNRCASCCSFPGFTKHCATLDRISRHYFLRWPKGLLFLLHQPWKEIRMEEVEQNGKYNTSEFAITSTSHTIIMYNIIYNIYNKYINEKKRKYHVCKISN